MDSSSTSSIDNFGLHHYAIIGDDEGVRRSLRDGADVNALDTAGRSTVMCAVAGENWQSLDDCDASFMTPTRLNALKMLLGHPEISLLTLNAPQSSMNGVIPLGMAAWLNQPQVVRTLLDDSADSVCVDGMDSHGAMALMYAARDGSLEVVQALLSHGARPDFRDRNHRTSIQFALPHPQILWLCETILRRHRWRESRSADRTRLSPETEYLVELACSSMPLSDDLEPPPTSIFTQEALSRLTNTLISSIRNSDVAFLHSLLFAPSVQPSSPSALYPMSVPVLINLLDSNGWSLVHHCVSAPEPSLEILDALYCAGADMSLFTTHEQQTPLHFLARNSSHNPESTHSLYDFVLHLIQDLRAPLSARDKDEETCIHIAAEHGHSIDLLMLFLHCDTNGTIRAMKNSRGLTALEVAKTEFLPAFGIDTERSTSALSNYTMRPTDSFASLSSLSDLHSFYRGTASDALSIFSTSDFDVDAAVQHLLSILRATSPSGYHSHKPAHIKYLDHSIDEISLHADSIIVHFRSRIEEATRVITDLQKNADRINSVRNVLDLATRSKLTVRGIAPLQSKRRHRDSEDSQTTFAVPDDDSAFFFSSASTRVPSCSSSDIEKDNYSSVGTQTALLDFYVAHNTLSRTDAAWMERFIQSPDSPVCRAHFANLWDVERELSQLERQAMTPRSANSSPTKVAMKLKQVLKKKKRLEEKIQDLEFDPLHLEKKATLSVGTSRFKAWIKRIVVPQQQPHSPPKLELVLDLDSADSDNVGHDVKRPLVKSPSRSTTCGDAIDRSIDRALRTSKVVLEAAHRDLTNITECLSAAEQFIDLANHSISRTQRVVKRAIKKRETMLTDLEQKASASSKPLPTIDESELSPGLLGYSNAITSRPSLASISTIYSTASTIASGAPTLTENDDEDIRILRRLLLRKIEAQTSGAWDEVDKVVGWVQIVKEAVRSVKRRAYL